MPILLYYYETIYLIWLYNYNKTLYRERYEFFSKKLFVKSKKVSYLKYIYSL